MAESVRLPSWQQAIVAKVNTPESIAKVIASLGVPSVIALVLSWGIATSLMNDVKEMRTDHQLLAFYLRATCLNAADDESERAACVPPSYLTSSTMDR